MTNERLRQFARTMRREPTVEEDRLWGALRGRRLMKLKFRRQVPIGPFIADFVCMEARLIVEADGVQHAENLRDSVRDCQLKAMGFRILRFWNGETMRELDAVCTTIVAAAREQGLQFD